MPATAERWSERPPEDDRVSKDGSDGDKAGEFRRCVGGEQGVSASDEGEAEERENKPGLC